MEEEIDLEQIVVLAKDKIDIGKALIMRLKEIDQVDGVKKVQRKISQEINCLANKIADQTLRINNVMCSNLLHFECLVKILLKCQGLTHVDYALPATHRNTPLRVDAVCDFGATWIKVIARNSRSIADAVHGRTSFGTKSILDQAEEFVEAAQQHLHVFKPPQIYFIFNSSIDPELIASLEEARIRVSALDAFQSESNWSSKVQLEGVQTLNLDITTLLGYVSALTNADPEYKDYYWQFAEPLLTEQSKWECRNPIKPVLDEVFASRKLICCETALSSFKDIISLLGGDNEKRRTEELLEKITILPDVEDLPETFAGLKIGGRIKSRSVKIFAFGLHHRAVTVTSNEGFVRAARMQGIEVPVFIHEARALTEEKEKNGKRVLL